VSYLLRGIHVGCTDFQAIRIARDRIAKEQRRCPKHRELRHKYYRQVLEAHHNHQQLVREWRL